MLMKKKLSAKFKFEKHNSKQFEWERRKTLWKLKWKYQIKIFKNLSFNEIISKTYYKIIEFKDESC